MRIGKELVAASATPLVLALLGEGESYGYALRRRVEELSGGELQWTDGMLYPVLHRLERNGWVEASWGESESGRRRKYYRLTERGREQLAGERRQWQVVDSTLRGLWFASLDPASGT
ncbi:MAG TPA: helix-turn-helix transcriptional regulator [Thermoanaerobaculia bacterium]|nr:helix-turn-helix transcriptional regulator [Thermoanaerobaculia bacterium]